tara:strand:- start:3574 stop:4044 length:471 start_codon:yes stop_codon:yes gene_type:complete
MFNATRVTTEATIVSSTGGTFDSLNIFNGGTASIIYVCDNIIAPELQVSTYNNDPTVTVEDSTLFNVGDLVLGTGIPADTKVSSITNATTIELSASTTGGDTTGPLTFHNISNNIAKFHAAADTSYFHHGFGVICRKGIKVLATDFSNLEIITIHN